MVIAADDSSLPPRYVVENYRRAYLAVNGREPRVRYMGNHWYSVNGETVHRSTLMEEIERLCSLARARSVESANKGVIHKLIARLKNL